METTLDKITKKGHMIRIEYDYENDMLPHMRQKFLLLTNYLLKDPDFSLLLCTDEIDIITRNAESYDDFQSELKKLGKKESVVMADTYVQYMMFKEVVKFIYSDEKFENLPPIIKKHLEETGLDKYTKFINPQISELLGCIED